jgi:hypothetical protein
MTERCELYEIGVARKVYLEKGARQGIEIHTRAKPSEQVVMCPVEENGCPYRQEGLRGNPYINGRVNTLRDNSTICTGEGMVQKAGRFRKLLESIENKKRHRAF